MILYISRFLGLSRILKKNLKKSEKFGWGVAEKRSFGAEGGRRIKAAPPNRGRETAPPS
jgi:hypothetical protein